MIVGYWGQRAMIASTCSLPENFFTSAKWSVTSFTQAATGLDRGSFGRFVLCDSYHLAKSGWRSVTFTVT
jgi:hypothetical protein